MVGQDLTEVDLTADAGFDYIVLGKDFDDTLLRRAGGTVFGGGPSTGRDEAVGNRFERSIRRILSSNLRLSSYIPDIMV